MERVITDGDRIHFILELGALALLVLGSWRAWRWWRSDECKVKKLLRAARHVTIADAQEGALVKVVGKVRSAGKQLQAPATGAPCVIWKVVVEQVGMREQRSHAFTQSDATDFWLEDESGRALVKPLIPELRLAVHELRFRGHSETPMPLKALLDANARAVEADLFRASGDDVVCQEGLVTEGETIAVLARARWEQDEETAGYRERGRRLVLEDLPPLVLRISDDPTLLD